MVSKSGGSSVAIIPPKAYLSLKTGVVDAMIMGWGAVAAFKTWEVTDYFLDYTVGSVPLPVIMSLEAWKAAPPNIKKLIEELSLEQLKVGCEGLYKSEARGRKLATEAGMKAVMTTPAERAQWKALLDPLEADWLSQMKAGGNTAAPKVLKRYKELAAEAAR